MNKTLNLFNTFLRYTHIITQLLIVETRKIFVFIVFDFSYCSDFFLRIMDNNSGLSSDLLT